METKAERDHIIDSILSRMEYGQIHKFGSLFEDYYLFQFKDSPEIVAKLINMRVYPGGNLVNALVKSMLSDGLIETVANSISTGEDIAIVRLTVKGQDIKESGGWKKYLETQKKSEELKITIVPDPKEKPSWFDTFGKVIALIEALVIIVLTPTAIWLQYKSSQSDQENKQLKEILRKKEESLDSLSTLFKNQKTDTTKRGQK